ncbi:MAG TPA: hypothetical protein VKV24_21295 [Casimicrobiaceae bacterium]|nr:hypothetical protein [Casimicrobiaceae bacterium]
MRQSIACLLLSLIPVAALADDNPLGLSYVDTPDLRLIYFDALDYLVPHAVRTFTNSLAFQRNLFDWMPKERTMVLLRDHSDYGNAATATVPRDRIFFDIAPLSHAFETFPASERMYTLMNHELVHVTQGDVASSEQRRWRRFFLGKVGARAANPESILYGYLTAPRSDVPRWYAEGGAVFMETWKDGGLGRAQGGYDEMVFRAMVRDDAHFYDPLGLVSYGVQTSFQTSSNAYLYGTRFFTWLAYVYSPQKVVDWMKLNDGDKAYYADAFRQVFGLPLDEAWQRWIAFEHTFQQKNLAEVRRNPITPFRRLAGTAMGSISRIYYDEKSETIYAAFRYPGFVEHVGAVNTRDGTETRLADIKGAMLYRVASFAYDPATGIAFYTNNNLAARDLMQVDVHTGEVRTLIEGARIGDFVLNPVDKALIGVRHDKGLATIVRVPYPYTDWQPIHAFAYEEVPYDLDISPDGRLLSASMSDANADQFVRVFDLKKLASGDAKPLSEFRFGQSIPESFVFSPDGRYLYGSSYYTGVSNIFRYEVATGDVEAVTNADIGFFRPVPLHDGRIVVLTYTGEGFVPAMIEPHVVKDISAITFLGNQVVEKYPIVKTWQIPPARNVDYEKLVEQKGPYVPLRNMGLDSGYPVLQGYKNAIGAGYRLNFSDSLDIADFGMTAAYTPTGHLGGNERLHFDMGGEYLGWRASLAWNRSDFYDLFGPTKRSRKGLAMKVGYDDLLIYDPPRSLTLSYDIEYYDKIDTLPSAQNVGTPFTQLLIGKVGLLYTDLRRSQGAVDDEKGLKWDAVVWANHVTDETPVQLHGTFDYGFALPIAHSSIWLRTAGGISSGRRDNPVANFYLGSFGNNYVDKGPEKRYRDYDSMPGFGIDEISGQSYVRQMIEWNLPPVVFESVGTPGMYLNWLRPAVFSSALVTDPGNSTFQKHYANVGTQIDLRFHVLHLYDMTLSVGYAVGFTGSRRSGDEVMVSLKIL